MTKTMGALVGGFAIGVLGTLLGVAPVAQAQPSEAAALRARATAILRAYRARDVDAMLAFVPPGARARTRRSIEPGGGAHESLFGTNSWRWREVSHWNGQLLLVRVRGDQARVQFADMGPDEVAVVTLRKTDGVWYFDDLHSPSRADFARWGERVRETR